VSEDWKVTLSVHAAYYIVLTSSDQLVVDRSVDTLKRTFDLAAELGAATVVLHPGPLYGGSGEDAKPRLVDNLGRFFNAVGASEIGLFLETAGKVGQFGSVEEIADVTSQVEGCFPCIDFGHVHARTLGTLDRPSSIAALFATLEALGLLGPTGRIHFHYTPIHFGPRGEISHKALDSIAPPVEQRSLLAEHNDVYFHPRFEPIVSELAKRQIACTVISETLNSQEAGALAMSQYYRTLV